MYGACMKIYTKENIVKTEVGKFNFSIGYLIGNTYFSRGMMFTFDDGKKCNADYEQEALNCMNKTEDITH